MFTNFAIIHQLYIPWNPYGSWFNPHFPMIFPWHIGAVLKEHSLEDELLGALPPTVPPAQPGEPLDAWRERGLVSAPDAPCVEDLPLKLVGGLEHFLFSHILGIIIPIDFHIFQRGSKHQPAWIYPNNGPNVGKSSTECLGAGWLMENPEMSWNIMERFGAAPPSNVRQ